MASYLDDEKYGDGLPSIRRSYGKTRRSLASMEDDLHVRFSNTAPASLYRERDSSPSIYPRPPSPTQNRRMVVELHEQLQKYKEDMKKKDNLIAQLSTLDTPVSSSRNAMSRSFDLQKDNWTGVDRSSADTARSEVAALQVKTENILRELRESQLDNDNKDSKIRELRNELEGLRENDARQSALVKSLRDRLCDAANNSGSLENVASRSEVTIATLQKENRDAQNRVIELEARLRSNLEDRESREHEMSAWERKYKDVVLRFSSALCCEDVSGFLPASPDTIMSKMTDLANDNAVLKGKLVTLQETLANTELESKASRETIMRLVSEVGREQKSSTKYTSDLEMIKSERDNAVHGRDNLERELELLREQLVIKQRAWDSTKRELEMREGRMFSLDRDLKEKAHSVQASQTQYSLFKESLSNLLSDAYHTVEMSEESIKDRLRHLQATNKDREAHLDMAENKVRDMTEKFGGQYEIRQSAERRIERLEAENVNLQDRLRRAEGDCAANEVFRDGLRTDKEKYLKFMEQIAEIMKMDRISAEIGYDMNGEAIIARAEQLIRLEGNALNDRSTHVYNLQRKVKSQKEQLESKDLHLDLLRKKITGVEERLLGRTAIEKEKDGETMKVRKLHRLVEKYQSQVAEANQEITVLKAQLLGSSNMKVRTLEQEREIEGLEMKIQQLDKIRVKQSKKIGVLKDEVDYTENELGEKRVVSENAVSALSSELRTTKMSLGELSKREKQLLDLRQVISRMLGLEINTLAVPDFEIISRLEKLIQAHHAHTVSAIGIESALEDMEDGFHAGYIDATRAVLSPRSRTRSRSRPRSRTRTRTRTRSMSPQRRTDPRQY